MSATGTKMGDFLMLRDVRIDWPTLFRVPIIQGEEGRIGCKAMLSKTEDKDAIRAILTEINRLARENNPDKEKEGEFKGQGKKLPKKKVALQDGDDSEKEKYHDHFTMNMNSSRRRNPDGSFTHEPVTTLGADGKPYTDESQKPVFYSGCRVNAKLRFWWQNSQDAKIGKRVNCTLVAIQFCGDGEVLDSTHVSDEMAMEGFGETGFADKMADGGDEWGDEEKVSSSADDTDDDDFI